MSTLRKLEKIKLGKYLNKIKKKVLRTYPGAKCFKMLDGTYEICSARGYPIRNPGLFLPKNTTVLEAWERAAYSIWFSGMVVKSFNAFSDEKMVKRVIKEIGEEEV